LPTNACNLQDALRKRLLALAGGFDGELQNRLKEADLGITDGKLSGVNANGDTAGACLAVIARKRALAAFVKLALRV
jgi:hypothetical protein